jgi:hypothetical protein
VCLVLISISLDFFSDVRADFLKLIVGSIELLSGDGFSAKGLKVWLVLKTVYFIVYGFCLGEASK